MKVLNNENIIFFDVDDTLVLWNKSLMPDSTSRTYTTIIDPHSKEELSVARNENNIKLLKEKHARGYTVIVWSQGGYEWAEAVVKSLDLTKYVSLVMSKPSAYVDDLDVGDWMPKRIYINARSRYKV